MKPTARERAESIANDCNLLPEDADRIERAILDAEAEARRQAIKEAADLAQHEAHETINFGAYNEDDIEAQVAREQRANCYRKIEAILRVLLAPAPPERKP